MNSFCSIHSSSRVNSVTTFACPSMIYAIDVSFSNDTSMTYSGYSPSFLNGTYTLSTTISTKYNVSGLSGGVYFGNMLDLSFDETRITSQNYYRFFEGGINYNKNDIGQYMVTTTNTTYKDSQNNNVTVAGDYLQLTLPYNLILDSYYFAPRQYTNTLYIANRFPRDVTVVGSNDLTNWYFIQSNTGIAPASSDYSLNYTSTAGQPMQKVSIVSNVRYTSFRFIITKITNATGAGDRISLSKFFIYGTH